MNRGLTLLTAALLACTGAPTAPSDKALVSFGTVELDSTELQPPDDFQTWQAAISLWENPHGTFRYILTAGAASPTTGATSGFRLLGDVQAPLQMPGTYALPDVATRGDRNQVNYHDALSWTSTDGALVIDQFEDGTMTGTWSASLVEVGGTRTAHLTGMFSGIFTVGCNLYDASADGNEGASWREVDVTDERCASQFDGAADSG
jgi:hypothetical protein